jgi:hypothetical protein
MTRTPTPCFTLTTRMSRCPDKYNVNAQFALGLRVIVDSDSCGPSKRGEPDGIPRREMKGAAPNTGLVLANVLNRDQFYCTPRQQALASKHSTRGGDAPGEKGKSGVQGNYMESCGSIPTRHRSINCRIE